MECAFRKLLWFSLLVPSIAYASTAGPNYPGTGTDDSSFGTTVWLNPGNITSSDNNYASLTTVAGVNTHYLAASNFGFSIPSSTTILGIQVEWERQALCGGGCTIDSRVRIIKGGVVGSTEKSTGASWPTGGVDVYDSFGGSSDLWGQTWTYTDINASNFGAVLSPTGVLAGALSEVDTCRITVTYTGGSQTSSGWLHIILNN